MSEKIEPQVGQVWRDNDGRFQGRPRHVVIESFTQPSIPGPVYAMVRGVESGRETRIKVERFRPNATGYCYAAASLDELNAK